MPTKKPAGDGTWVDPDDAPELTDGFFARAKIRDGDTLVRRARSRPKAEDPKQQVTVRLDHDVLARFRATGPGWQSRLNEAAREWLERR